jgi:methylated-DNA-[protein]-cysteine S-methyltransferase
MRISRGAAPDRLINMNSTTPQESHGRTVRTRARARSGRSWTIYESPLGPLTLFGGREGLSGLYFPGKSVPLNEGARADRRFGAVVSQLESYFAGTLQAFDLELDVDGTPFQRQVWAQLATIPYGSTRSYGAMARAIGRADCVRAVAAAIGRTPVPIVIPCHRVVASDGALTGYGGGLHRKRALLDLEATVSGAHPLPALWQHRQLSLA